MSGAGPNFDPERVGRYHEVRDDLERLVLVAATASEPWASRRADERRRETGNLLFAQAAQRAESILRLAPDFRRERVEAPAHLDVLSIRTVLRALLEGYLSLYYLSLEPVGSEEVDLRFRAWDLCGEAIRVKGLRYANPEHPRLAELEREKAAYADGFRGHPLYGGIPQGTRKAVEDGTSPFLLPRPEIARRAGITSRQYHALYKHVADYSHGGPLAEAQFAEFFRNPSDQLDNTYDALRSAVAVLSLVVLNFEHVYKRSKWRIEPEDARLMLAWARIMGSEGLPAAGEEPSDAGPDPDQAP